MKIKKLEIVGFKSFVDRTVLHFDHEVTGIVGPNGCGKSNVVDAIKWVMGEQSAQRLRGKAMDDVIFSGSEARGPGGFAEVALTFDNTDGLAPPEYQLYAEITVARRLDREGRSDYFINKTLVRLMDVTNLFLGTGVGRRAYSIIEQGRIGYIVSSKPEDRRQMLDEAAGVTKFKVRRRAAERKMDQTRQNLLRVSDILGVLERDLASLQRQAQKAERYKKYRAEARDLELWIASHRFLELHVENRVVGDDLRSTSARSEGARLALRVREAELEAERALLQSASHAVEQAQNRAYTLDNRVRMLEAEVRQRGETLDGLREREAVAERDLDEVRERRTEIDDERAALLDALAGLESAERETGEALRLAQEELARRRTAVDDAERTTHHARARLGDARTRIARAEAVLAGFERRRDEARARRTKLEAEGEALTARRAELDQQAAELEARLVGLREGKMQTAERRTEIEAELVAARAALGTIDAALDTLREETAQKRSRLRSLEELQKRFEGVGAGVRTLMTKLAATPEQRAAAKVIGLVADRVDCPAELTRALAAALGERLQHVVTEDVGASVDAVRFLRGEGRGRAALVPRQVRRVVGAEGAPVSGPGVIGRLADLVRMDASDEPLVRHLLGGVVVVDTLDTALRLHREGAESAFVAVDGDRLDADGTVTGGAADDSAAHMLEMKREIRELVDVVARLESALGAAVHEQGTLRTSIAERQATLDAARSEAHDAEIAIVKAEKDLRAAREEAQRESERKAALAREIEAIGEALSAADEEEREAEHEIAAARAVAEEAERDVAEAEEIARARRDAVEEQAQQVTAVQVRAAEARQRAQSDRDSVERLDRALDELAMRRERLRSDIEHGARQQGRLAGEILLHREELGDAVAQAMQAHESLVLAKSRYEEAQLGMGHQESEIKSLRATLEGLVSSVSELAIRERELTLATEHLLGHVGERHALDLRRVIGDYHDRVLPDAAVKERVDELQRLIQRMGEINLTAIEELETKSREHEYLFGQRKDLEEALDQLDKAIKQMNKESRTLFRDAFAGINERFKRIFPQLFRGGKAELRMTDPEDLLESGIDILAQPPGKKVGSLELMSGGEKALTAVALIFAMFQYKPSPFCLLDEVDAPLDEANIARFAEAVRQMTDRSQFIVITHSKRTMEYTDVLYGVTMEQPGVSKVVAVELRGQRRPTATDGADERQTQVA